MSRSLLGLICIAAAMVSSAAAAAAPAAANSPLGGPQVPGVCFLSQEAVFANSKVGQAATARLRQLAQDASAPLISERQSIETDAKALASDQGKVPAVQLQSRHDVLSLRAQAYQASLQEVSRRVEATRANAAQQIAQAAQPIVVQAYHARGCGLLLNRNVVIGGNLAGDLTPDIVSGLDAKITAITFDLEPAPAAATASTPAR